MLDQPLEAGPSAHPDTSSRDDGSSPGTPAQRERSVDALVRQRCALHVELLRIVAAADDAKDHEADGCHSMADWLVAHHRLPHAVARQWVTVAHAFAVMPLIEARYATGDVSFEQVVEALRFAEPKDDAALARLLPTLSFAEIEQMAKQRRRIRRRERELARGERFLRLRPDASGLGSRVSGFLPTEDAAIVRAALDRRAESAGPDPDTGVWAPHEARTADALRDVCADDLARQAAESTEPDASIVIVHVPASAVGRDEPGPDGSATIDGTPIDNEALHRILCDTKIELHVDTPDGRTVGIGRATRNPPRWLRRRVIGRDHGRCRWPGCGRALRHLHHMQHWTKGGPTDAANLLGVCWHHHHLLHEGGWNATGDADHHVVFTGPTGRTLSSRTAPAAA